MNETEQLLEQVAGHVRNSPPEQGHPLPPVLDGAELARAEAILGATLPPLLTGLHTRVADGGFGPGYGLLPLREALKEYEEMRASGWRWPAGVLPIAHYGCGMYACVDCHSETAQVLLFEPNLGDPDLAWFIDAPGLADWLRGWLDGTAWHCEDFEEEEGDLELTPWDGLRSRP
ncbi:SMI1/KNR4 family protein [Streptomyces sp. NPDC090022]|uniref:SMI1/KNR4 family protein n=1 Tax=Streptomyces sp. NPDC090022 TaxID=3365920 RepID=UPI0037F78414